MIGIAKQFISFGFVGAVNTILNLVIYWVLTNCGVNYLVANLIGFIITVFISYILNNKLTFNNSVESKSIELDRLFKCYSSYFLSGIIINSLLLYFWNDIIRINHNISPVLNLFITVPINFLLNKFWVFGKK